MSAPGFEPSDDALHDAGDDFYHTETYWFSFFVPERALGGWLYTSVRRNAGVSTGGFWVWDPSGTDPWEVPFYERFSWLKPPSETGPDRLVMPSGGTITTVEPGMVYDLAYDDRDRVTARLRFAGIEEPVPLRTGTPPFPKASHFDQTGHVTGHLVLDGERIDVDCFAMRDRSWGMRKERGFAYFGYTWLADADRSLLTYSRPAGSGEEIYAGYLRRDGTVSHLASGSRRVERDPERGWVTAMHLDATDELGRRCTATGTAKSRMILPGSTSITVNSVLEWNVDGVRVHGEDQDVWPLKRWRALCGRSAGPTGRRRLAPHQ